MKKRLNEGTYQIIVNNIGTVYDGDDYDEASEVYESYIDMSQHGGGRAFGEDVMFMEDGDVIDSYDGDLSDEYKEDGFGHDDDYPYGNDQDSEEGYAYTSIAMMPEGKKGKKKNKIYENIYNESPTLAGSLRLIQEDGYDEIENNYVEPNPYAYIDEIGGWPNLGEKLEQALKDNGFVGIDMSLDISLFEYGMIYSEQRSELIQFTQNPYDVKDEKDIWFVYQGGIDEDYVLSELESVNQGFYETLGTTKEEYEDSSLSMIIYDLISEGYIDDQGSKYTGEELYKELTSGESINESINESKKSEPKKSKEKSKGKGVSMPSAKELRNKGTERYSFPETDEPDEVESPEDIEVADSHVYDYKDKTYKVKRWELTNKRHRKGAEEVEEYTPAYKRERELQESKSPDVVNYIRYLRDTLIPDLEESGKFETADDFRTCLTYITRDEYNQEFVGFLKDILIPDLRESGYDATADDFETCISLMEGDTDVLQESKMINELYRILIDDDSTVWGVGETEEEAIENARSNYHGDEDADDWIDNDLYMEWGDQKLYDYVMNHGGDGSGSFTKRINGAWTVEGFEGDDSQGNELKNESVTTAFNATGQGGEIVDPASNVDSTLGESDEKIDNETPPIGTLYIKNSSIFDNPNNKYDISLFIKTLKDAGARNVWTSPLYGWSNQPQVVLFNENELSEEEAKDALNQLPVFKIWGVIIRDAYLDWTIDDDDDDDDMDYSDEPDEPNDEDWQINEDEGTVYEDGKPMIHFKFSDDYDWNDLFAEIREEMEKQNWYPNVWTRNDHGNWFLENVWKGHEGEMHESRKPKGKIITENVGKPITLKNLKSHFRDYIAHDNIDESELNKLVDMINSANNHDSVDEALDFANEIFHGYGVEPIRDEDVWDNYYGDTIALYVNFEDTYLATLLYDINEDEFYLTSWGDWIEEYEQKNNIRYDDDGHRIYNNDDEELNESETIYDKIDSWIETDDTLRNMALNEGVSESDIGNGSSEKYYKFVEDNYYEIIDSINKATRKS